ncbi:unnamed protein product [Aphis gossypii]|uniref:Repressor of the inhibitor of the protein kinase n=1 Tax=Aphis gossypii TaxID=80765 RepID=A0A9P0NJB0_APHGO|nr:unnamed protein product [Aphis gossypii]
MSGKKRDGTLFSFFNKKTKNEHVNISNIPNDLDVIEDPDKSDAKIHPPEVLKMFVKEPLTNYKKAPEFLKHHASTQYHLLATEKISAFIQSFKTGESVEIMLNNKVSSIMESNRKRLVPIIKTIIFCGHNNLPLRGHRDDGILDIDSALVGTQGIFRSLLAFRIDSGDKELTNHIRSCKKNSTMISKTIQNDIINILHKVIIETIVTNVKKYKYFSILCDETTDISTKEQMTFSVRYIDMEEMKIKEEFLGFIELNSTTGSAIKDTMVKQLECYQLSLKNLRGQGYDGGSNMSGRNNGVQALILKDQPLAVYTHCFNHKLNLCISKACEIQAIRNLVGIVGSISVFLSTSAKRTNIMLEIISKDDSVPVPQKKKLKALCATRWVERHDSIITFRELYSYIVITLEELEKMSDSETACKAVGFSASIKRSEFLISLEIVANLFSYTKTLSLVLQSPKLELSKAFSHVNDVINVIENIRENSTSRFETYFKNASDMAALVGEDIRIPRICGRQTTRCNIQTTDPMEWYRITIFLPFIDHLISQLKIRFNEKLSEVMPLEGLIPAYIDKYDESNIIKAAMIYNEDWSGQIMDIQSEISIWKNKWSNIQTIKPDTVIETMKHCDEFFPIIKTLLHVFATIPVTTASAERSFSTLRRLKNYLRSTMGQDRLNGLAVLNVHNKMPINIDEVINIFSRSSRRIKTEDWSI